MRRFNKKRNRRPKRKGRARKRNLRKKLNKPTTITIRGVAGQLFPDIFRTVAHCTSTQQVGANASNGAYFLDIPLNQPAITNAKSAPYSQVMSTLYKNYRVWSSAIKVTLLGSGINSAPNNGDGIAMSIFPQPTVTVPTSGYSMVSFDTWADVPYAKTMTIPGQLTTRCPVLKNYISVERVMGVRKASLEQDNYSGLTSVSVPYTLPPTQALTWWILTSNPISTTSIVLHQYRVDVWYYMEYFDRITNTS